MAEQFLTLMADLDIDSQNRMSEWYNVLKKAGFNGIQTPGLPYHITLLRVLIGWKVRTALLPHIRQKAYKIKFVGDL